MKHLLLVLCLLVPSSVRAADTFILLNTYPRTATFQFFATELQQWEGDPLKLHSGANAHRTLKSQDPYTLQFHTSAGYIERLDNINFHQLIANNQGVTIALKEIYFTEERTRTVVVEKMRAETRTKTYQVTKMVPEERTRIVRRRDPRTGRIYEAEETYTVMVRRDEERTVEYTVQVPYSEQAVQTYTVRVPGTRLEVSAANGDVAAWELRGAALGVGGAAPVDARKRYLGINIRNSAAGPLVTKVSSGSPATRLSRLSQGNARRYRLIPNRSIITEVNGVEVENSTELVAAIQQSPPIVVLTVFDRNRQNSAKYEAYLEMR